MVTGDRFICQDAEHQHDGGSAGQIRTLAGPLSRVMGLSAIQISRYAITDGILCIVACIGVGLLSDQSGRLLLDVSM